MLSQVCGTVVGNVGKGGRSGAAAYAVAAVGVGGSHSQVRAYHGGYYAPSNKKAPNDTLRGKKGQLPVEYPPLPDGKMHGLAWPPSKMTIYNRAKKTFNYEMSAVRLQYKDEYRDWKEKHDAEKTKRWLAVVARKEKHAAARKIKRSFIRAEQEKKNEELRKQKIIEAVGWTANRVATEKKRSEERMHQLDYLLAERERSWILNFDTDLKGDTLFDTRSELTGFWVKPHNKTKPKTTVMNLMEDKSQEQGGLEFDSDDERDLLDFEKINQKRFGLGHLPDAR